MSYDYAKRFDIICFYPHVMFYVVFVSYLLPFKPLQGLHIGQKSCLRANQYPVSSLKQPKWHESGSIGKISVGQT